MSIEDRLSILEEENKKLKAMIDTMIEMYEPGMMPQNGDKYDLYDILRRMVKSYKTGEIVSNFEDV